MLKGGTGGALAQEYLFLERASRSFSQKIRLNVECSFKGKYRSSFCVILMPLDPLEGDRGFDISKYVE